MYQWSTATFSLKRGGKAIVSQIDIGTVSKAVTPKIRVYYFVLINSVLFFSTVYVFGSCFRTLAVILVSDFSFKSNIRKAYERLGGAHMGFPKRADTLLN